MKNELAGLAVDECGAPLYAVRPQALEALLATLPGAAALAAALGFTAAAGRVLVLPGDGQTPVIAVLGLGEDTVLHGFGAAATALPAGSVWRLMPFEGAPEDAALGFLLGAYRFDLLKSTKSPAPARLEAVCVPARVQVVATAITLARDLINTPANLLGPAELAEAALAVAAHGGATAERVTGADLTARYPALAAVGAGSSRAPEVVSLRWQGSTAPADAPLISLCGKGVCFDTGGYDLKPSAAMLRMKKDMGGAAIMLGVAYAIMSLNLPIKLQLRIGCVENSISGHALRPSDVLRTRAGLSVEVGNTDAEGRLVLCDLLAEAAAESPAWLLDAATLTGAARVALGPDLPALFSTDDELADILLHAGRETGDPLWRLPLHEGYASWLESTIADTSNVSAKPYAGAIVAALFLQKFIGKSTSWAHIDVYAWNDSSRPARPEGGEAQSLRAVLRAIETRAGCPM
jgi:leucyl aminopeptidase